MTRREFPALGADPAPGDPVALAATARQATAAATDFATAADRFAAMTRGSDGSTWTGDAADAFRTTLGPLPTDLGRAADAHRTAARVLDDYAAGLHARQVSADLLEAEAAALRAREATAIAEVNRLAGTRAPAGSAEFAALSADYTAARGRAASAGADLAAVLAAAKLLAEDHRVAATAAARSLRAAGDTAPYEKPGLLSRALDRTKRWITDHADVLTSISTVLKGMSAVLGTLSLVPGLQFLAPFAMAAGGLALALDVAVKLSTGRGSWRALALDGALTVLPTGPVARGLKKLTDINLGLAAINGAIPRSVKGPLFRFAGNRPEGVSKAEVREARRLIKTHAAHYGDDVVVQGCRANYSSERMCDVDIAIRVSPEDFHRIAVHRYREGTPIPNVEEVLAEALRKGVLHKRRAGMLALSKNLTDVFGTDVDLSVVRRGSSFDLEPWLPL